LATEPFEALPIAPAHDDPQATMPPQRQPTDAYAPLDPAVAATTAPYDPLLDSDPGAAPVEGDPMLNVPSDELDDAPTRIEREEEIQSHIGGGPSMQDVPRVVIIGGNNRGKEYPLQMRDNSLGRGVDNDVILADIAVSRKHTLICYEGGGFVLRDLGSGNGTLLNGKRVDSHLLQDGDQLELGNTLLRFISPSQPAPIMPANVGAIAKLETVVTPRAMAEEMRMTADVPAVVHTAHVDHAATRREPRGPGLSRTMKLLIVGGGALVLLFGVMIVLKLTLSRKKPLDPAAAGAAATQSTRPPDEIAAQEFQEGTTQYRNRNWDKARVHFLKVLTLAPSFDQAKHYADQAAIEISAQSALSRAKNSLAAKDYATARQELSKIPSTSNYAPDTRTLKQKVDDEQVSLLLETAKTLKAAGDAEGALAKVTEARAIAPTNKEVLELHNDLSGATKRVAIRTSAPAQIRSTSPRPSPHPRPGPAVRPRPQVRQPAARAEPPETTSIKVHGVKAKAALSAYGKKQWGQAYKEAKEGAAELSGRRRSQADSLAEAIRMVGQSWTRAESASKPVARIKYYELAIQHDAKIPKRPHQRALKKLIATAALAEATNALSRKQYPAAYAAAKLAEKHGGRDQLLVKVNNTLEQEAMKLFTRGYTMRSSDKAQARRLWQQILRMVPSSSKAYQKAYTYLNNSTPSYQDEDED